jgi:hypothetical protein
VGSMGALEAASFLARFLACLSRRRSRSLLSRVSFAIVVFLLPVDAMLSVLLAVWGASVCTTRVRRTVLAGPIVDGVGQRLWVVL